MVLGARRLNDVMRAGLIFGIGCCANSPTRGTSVRSSHGENNCHVSKVPNAEVTLNAKLTYETVITSGNAKRRHPR